MARKKREHHEEHENLERWLVSYADFITLLFAFFVVMYAMSSVNEGKYKILSETLSLAFSEHAAPVSPPLSGGALPDKTPQPPEISPPDPALARLQATLVKRLKPLIDKKLVQVAMNKRGVIVDINASVLFRSGEATLTPEARPIILAVAEALTDLPNQVLAEGYTDDQPINTLVYPTNWELSAGRAIAVVRMMQGAGIAPARLGATGYGEFRPRTENTDELSRAQNRRVSIAILTNTGRAPALAGDPGHTQNSQAHPLPR